MERIPQPDLKSLTSSLLSALPSSSPPSQAFLSQLAPRLRARLEHAHNNNSSYLQQLSLSHPLLASSIARALSDPALHFSSASGFKRISPDSILASAILSAPDSDTDLELVWTYIDTPGHRGWKLSDVRPADADLVDDGAYWRPWTASVAEAEAVWSAYQAERAETLRIKNLLIQLRAEALAALDPPKAEYSQQQQFVESAWSSSKEAAYSEEDTDVTEDSDDEGSYWSRYTVAPSKELMRSLHTIRRITLEDQEEDYTFSSAFSTEQSVGEVCIDAEEKFLYKKPSFLKLLPDREDLKLCA
ncbi:hypothetical protein BZA70DRAFT_297682 [Myxozyma melibiosi]|uniref:Rrn9 domain-containing protein n=1 Tax=Myxozyma melibiosi TaxID=54550 RepID=A0ABR1EYZ5_9ASCO